MFFCKIEGLKELESQNKWEEILIYLHNTWKLNKDNDEILLRLATESWFVLSNFENLNIPNTVYFLASKVLKETFAYKRENFSDNKLEVIFGYMMTIYPSYFCENSSSDKEQLELENMGKQMLKNAYNNNPENKLNATLYFGTDNKFLKNYKKAKKDLQPLLGSLFTNETEIEKYFNEVLLENNKI